MYASVTHPGGTGRIWSFHLIDKKSTAHLVYEYMGPGVLTIHDTKKKPGLEESFLAFNCSSSNPYQLPIFHFLERAYSSNVLRLLFNMLTPQCVMKRFPNFRKKFPRSRAPCAMPYGGDFQNGYGM